MWQASNSKSGSGKKRNRLRLNLNVSRVNVSLKTIGPNEITVLGRVLMIDLSNKGVGLFVSQLLIPGLLIELEITTPKQLKFKGKVVWCHEHHLNSHVISETPFAYRAGIQFSFENDAEAEEAQRLCAELATETGQKVG